MLKIIEEALTFDDLLLVPAYSEVLPKEVELKTKLTRNINLNIPLVSAAMDTVTEARLAIALAQEGGIGIIHKSMSIEKQAQEVRKVKRHESVIVRDPVTVLSDTKVKNLIEMAREHGFSGFPVLENGQLVGIVTGRDLRANLDEEASVKSIMTPKEKLITAKESTSLEEIKTQLYENRVEKMLLVDDSFALKGLVTFRDLEKIKNYPSAAKDANGSLLVGAAVGTSADTEQRVLALAEAGVDVLIVDTAHGHSKSVLEKIKWIKSQNLKLDVIGGNIATPQAALDLIKAGADGVKVGIGPGSICTTRIVAGVGVPQISAISKIADALKDTGVPLIADGGIRFSGDFAKAIAAGASCIMVGSLFAGTEEAPGEVELYQGRSYKSYRGMGSLGAMSQGSSDRYFQEFKGAASLQKLVPEGIEGRVPYKGLLSGIIYQLIGGLRSSMGYTGCKNIEEMRTKPEFVKITAAGIKESHVHDVQITKEAPNYRMG